MTLSHPSQDPSLWSRLRNARVPQLMGVYAGVSFGVLQGGDIFVERLGLPNWTFFGLVVLLLAGIPVVIITAMVQQARRADEGRQAEATLLRRAESSAGGGSAPEQSRAGPEPIASSGSTSLLRRVFTWRNTGFAGVGAVGILTILVAGFMILRALGVGPLGSLVAAGVLDRDEPILIANFQSQTGDALLAGAVTEAFRIDLEQSPLIRVVGPGTIREGLARMQLPPDSPLHPSLARDLALREGIKAIFMGEINPAGQGSILSVRLVSTQSEETLISYRESIPDSASIIPAVDRISNRMRERIGESLRSIRAGESLERVSTASLPALRRYSQGVRAVDLERDFPTGIALLEEAVELDPAFAMAWRKLGVTLMNGGYPAERWRTAMTRAYELRDRLTERERYLTQGTYYSAVAQDHDRAVASYRALLEIHPSETAALNNLAGLLSGRGDPAGAAELYERALQLDPLRSIYYSNLLIQLVAMGEWDRAREILDRFLVRFSDIPGAELIEAAFHAARGDHGAAATAFQRVLDNPRTPLQEEVGAEGGLMNLALLGGRLEEGERRRARLSDLRRRMGWEVQDEEIAYRRLTIQFAILADTVGAVRALDGLLPEGGLPLEAGAEGAHLEIASFLVVVGQPDRARLFIREWDGLDLRSEDRELFESFRSDLEAHLAAADGRYDEAISRLTRSSRVSGCAWCSSHQIAEIHEAAGDVESAIAEYERFVEGTWLHRLELDAILLPRTHERLAELYHARGDAENARRHLARFVELWEGADSVLQPRVERARERLSALEAVEE